MTTCPACARGLEPDWKFCVWCGAPREAARHQPTATTPGGTVPSTPPSRSGLVLPIVLGSIGVVVALAVAGFAAALTLAP